MTAHWKLTWNKKYYDVERLINDFPNMNDDEKVIFCSKGRAYMKNLPREGDLVTVVVVPHGKKIFSGIVIEGFSHGTSHQTDLYNLGKSRPHAEIEEFAKIKLIDILDREPCSGGRKTWTAM